VIESHEATTGAPSVPLLYRGISVPLAIATALIGLAIYAFHNLPGIQVLRSDAMTTVAIAIFAATYLVIANGKLPGFHLDRAGAALLGEPHDWIGCALARSSYRAVDFDTIALLLGMMIVVANLRLSGFFRLVNNWVVTRARHPFALLAAIVLVAGSLSAFLVNDTICLVTTPLVLEVITRLRRKPVPYLLAIAMASNIGSTATITGNPQNMIIGSLSHIPYGAFAASLWPVAAAGLGLAALLIALIYPGEFLARERLPAIASIPARHHTPLVVKSVLTMGAMTPCSLPANRSPRLRSWAARCCCSPAG
jgi:Na+/H+ antiporter NhaD/arsenite permease-like protein